MHGSLGRPHDRTRRWSGHAAACLALALPIFACAPEQVQPPPPVPPPRPPLVEVPEPPPAPPCERVARIDVWKSERQLVAFCEGGALLTLTAAMGRDPEGTKQRAGDMRTPEGDYRISGRRLPSRRFHAFIPIDYPSVADAEAALAEGRISRSDYERILAAHEAGEHPPSDTPLGGEIGFHGEGTRWRGESGELDWTYGCIAVSDADIAYLAERLEVGVPVTIHP